MNTVDFRPYAVNLGERHRAAISNASLLTRSNASDIRLARIGQLMDIAKAILDRRTPNIDANRQCSYRYAIAKDRYLTLRNAYRVTAFPPA